MPLWIALGIIAAIGLAFIVYAFLLGRSADDSSDEISDQIAHSDLAQLSPLELRAVQSRLGGDLRLDGRVGFAETGSTRFAPEARSGLRPPGDDPARVVDAPVHSGGSTRA